MSLYIIDMATMNETRMLRSQSTQSLYNMYKHTEEVLQNEEGLLMDEDLADLRLFLYKIRHILQDRVFVFENKLKQYNCYQLPQCILGVSYLSVLRPWMQNYLIRHNRSLVPWCDWEASFRIWNEFDDYQIDTLFELTLQLHSQVGFFYFETIRKCLKKQGRIMDEIRNNGTPCGQGYNEKGSGKNAVQLITTRQQTQRTQRQMMNSWTWNDKQQEQLLVNTTHNIRVS